MSKDKKKSSGFTQVAIWWLVWVALLIGILFIYIEIGISKVIYDDPDMTMDYLGLQPLIVSVIIRWVVLPRLTHARAAFQLFIIGIVLAESASYIGLFLAQQWKEELFFLGLLGMIQFVPVFLKRYRGI